MSAPAGARRPQVTRREALFGGNDDAHLSSPVSCWAVQNLSIHRRLVSQSLPLKGAELCQHALQRAILS